MQDEVEKAVKDGIKAAMETRQQPQAQPLPQPPPLLLSQPPPEQPHYTPWQHPPRYYQQPPPSQQPLPIPQPENRSSQGNFIYWTIGIIIFGILLAVAGVLIYRIVGRKKNRKSKTTESCQLSPDYIPLLQHNHPLHLPPPPLVHQPALYHTHSPGSNAHFHGSRY